jgi:hypothetical protein
LDDCVMRKTVAVVVVGLGLLAGPEPARAQCNAQAPGGTLCGVPTGAQALPRIAAPSVFGVPTMGGANNWTGTQTFLSPVNVQGQTSGVVSIAAQAATASYSFNLPAGPGAPGECLTSGGSGAAAMTWAACGPANPTASLGLAASNGVATTFMRSDAAPALSQAIAPTWTGTHTFSNATAVALTGKYTQSLGALPVPGEQIGRSWITGVGGQRGSVNGNGGYNLTLIQNDSSNLWTGVLDQVVQMGHYLAWTVGGPDAAGIRYGVFSSVGQNANINKYPSAFTVGSGNYQHEIVAISGIIDFDANLTMGGTDAEPWGNGIGLYGQCTASGVNVGSANRRYRSCIGAEADTIIETGANFDIITNLWLVTANKSSGVTVDSFVTMTGSPGTGRIGKDTGILFTNYAGLAPLKPTGTLLKTVGAGTVAHGIDWSSYVFTGNAINTGAFRVTGSGNIVVTNTDPSADPGPVVQLVRNSGTPAANDLIGIVQFYGLNTGGSAADYADIVAYISSATAGATQGGMLLRTETNGAATARIRIERGVQIGTPTGADMGVGTINVQTDVYRNGLAYTFPDYVFEHYYSGKVVKFSQNEGASDYFGLMPLDELRAFTKANYRLPRIDNDAMGIFKRGDVLLEKMEENTLYILQLNDEIKALKACLRDAGCRTDMLQ